MAGAAAASVTVTGGGFETPEVGAGYSYAPNANFTNNSGVAGNGSAWGFAPAPEGDQVAFIQTIAPPAVVSVGVTGLTVGKNYTATFHLAARPGYAVNPVTVAFNGTTIGTFTAASTAFTAVTTSVFTAGASSGTLTFTGAHQSGDTSVGLDNVTVAGGEVVAFRYDALGRLTGTSTDTGPNDGATSAVGYDPAGNRSIYASSASGPPAFSVGDTSALEGGGLAFTVVKSGTGAASVSYGTANGTASAAGGDFHGASGGLVFAAEESMKTVVISTIDDSSDEPAETLTLSLVGPSAGSTIADGQGTGTIFDNDEPPPPPPPPPPSFSVSDASVSEGGILVFTVTKTGAAVAVFAVDFATAAGTAASTYNGDGDYYTSAAKLYFQPSETSKTVSVQTIDDPMDEVNETLSLSLSNPTGGATISDAQGIGTIVDNDEQPPNNIPPTPQSDVGTQPVCTVRTYDVLTNDTDPDNNMPLTLIGSSHPSFTIANNKIEVDSSTIASEETTTYTVRDAGGATATATLKIFLTAGNCGGGNS